MTPLEKVQARIVRLSKAIQRGAHWQTVVCRKLGKDWLACGHSLAESKERTRYCVSCSLTAHHRRNRSCSV
jgi:hypothetical protein